MRLFFYYDNARLVYETSHDYTFFPVPKGGYL